MTYHNGVVFNSLEARNNFCSVPFFHSRDRSIRVRFSPRSAITPPVGWRMNHIDVSNFRSQPESAIPRQQRSQAEGDHPANNQMEAAASTNSDNSTIMRRGVAVNVNNQDDADDKSEGHEMLRSLEAEKEELMTRNIKLSAAAKNALTIIRHKDEEIKALKKKVINKHRIESDSESDGLEEPAPTKHDEKGGKTKNKQQKKQKTEEPYYEDIETYGIEDLEKGDLVVVHWGGESAGDYEGVIKEILPGNKFLIGFLDERDNVIEEHSMDGKDILGVRM